MEQGEGPEIQRTEIQTQDRLRAVQREKIFHEHFKNPSKRELIKGLIPSDRQRPDTAVDAAALRYLAESLGKDAHTAFFGLAATSKNPMELQNIFFNIASLKKVESLYWKFEESEDHFLRRKLPENINVSDEAENQAEAMRTGINIARNDPQHLLESFLYVISARNVPLEEKKRILSDVYSAKAFMSDPSENKASRKIYGSDSSFWSHVDGSWIDPKLAPIVAPEGLLKEPKEKVARRTEEAKAGASQPETPLARKGRIRGLLAGLNEFLAQPSDEATRLRDADQQASEDLRRALGSLAGKVPDLFRRTPQETAETEAAGEQAETPTQRTSRIRRMLAGLNEFLAQPSDEATRLRDADQQASEDLRRALASLARKVPDLFRRTRSIDNNPTKLPEKEDSSDNRSQGLR
jgi:hypothetical protein